MESVKEQVEWCMGLPRLMGLTEPLRPDILQLQLAYLGRVEKICVGGRRWGIFFNCLYAILFPLLLLGIVDMMGQGEFIAASAMSAMLVISTIIVYQVHRTMTVESKEALQCVREHRSRIEAELAERGL